MNHQRITEFRAYLEHARDRAEADVERCEKTHTGQHITNLYFGRFDAFREVLDRLDILEE